MVGQQSVELAFASKGGGKDRRRRLAQIWKEEGGECLRPRSSFNPATGQLSARLWPPSNFHSLSVGIREAASTGHTHRKAFVVLRSCRRQGLLLQEAFQRHLQTWASRLVCPSVAVDPVLVRNPSEPSQALNGVVSVLGAPWGFPLWPGLSFEPLPQPPPAPPQAPLLPCPGAVGHPHRTTILGRRGRY